MAQNCLGARTGQNPNEKLFKYFKRPQGLLATTEDEAWFFDPMRSKGSITVPAVLQQPVHGFSKSVSFDTARRERLCAREPALR